MAKIFMSSWQKKSPSTRDLLVTIFEQQDVRMTTAVNGREVLREMENGGVFGLILMDVQMPRMDGYEATGIIREKEKETRNHIPIIALTAHAHESDRERCLQAGMDDYIAKPFKFEEIFAVVERQLAGVKTPPQ